MGLQVHPPVSMCFNAIYFMNKCYFSNSDHLFADIYYIYIMVLIGIRQINYTLTIYSYKDTFTVAHIQTHRYTGDIHKFDLFELYKKK